MDLFAFLRIRNFIRSTMMVAAAAVIVGCGGGGGGGGGGGSSGSTPTATITDANGPQIVAATLGTAGEMVGTGSSGIGTFGSTSLLPARAAGFNLGDFARKELLRAQARIRTFGMNANVVSVAQTVPGFCDNESSGGSASIDVTATSESIVFTNCTVAGVTFDGSEKISNISVSGDPSVDTNWSVSATFSYHLTVDDGVEAVTFQGKFSVMVAVANSTDQSGSITVASLTVDVNGSSTTLHGVTITYSVNTSGDYSYSLDGAIAEGSFGTVSITTNVPFEGNDVGTNHPTQGQMTIVGASGKLVLTVESGGVEIDIYDNASDTVPSTVIHKTWAELDAL